MIAWYQTRAFPAAYDFLMDMGKLESRRASALAEVRGDTLEVGIGTGLNLPHYPDGLTHLTAVDSNPGMLRQLERKLPDSRIQVDFRQASVADLPFPDDQFDTVVSTHVLCSVVDRAAALREIIRVLKPDGRFVFLEHGLSPDPSVANWQKRLNGIQKRFAVGCLLDVPVKDELQAAGFAFESLTMGYQEQESKTHGYLYEGVGVKNTMV